VRKQEEDKQLVYGIRPVMEAIQAGKEVDRIYITRNATGALMQELKKLLQEREIHWQEVPIEKIHRITRNNHQDVVCYISPVSYASLSSVVQSVFENGETPLIVLLDRITDVRNFGAIARTAECAGVHALVIPYRGAAQVTADAVKTSAGALNRIPVCREGNLRDTVRYLKSSGLTVGAVTEKSKAKYFESDLTGPLALIMGSEEDGVSSDLLKESDMQMSIPMFGEISSLNVSVAAGILMFEAIRQRTIK